MNQTEQDFLQVFNHKDRKQDEECRKTLSHPGLSAIDKDAVKKVTQ